MNKRPLVAIAGCWVAGASVLSLWQGQDAAFVLAGILSLMLAFAFAGRSSWKITICCVIALLGAAGQRTAADHGNVSEIGVPHSDAGTDAVLTGYISSTVEVDGDVVMFELMANTLETSPTAKEQQIDEKVLLRLKLAKEQEQKTAFDWGRGDAIQVAGKLELPGQAGNFGAFDYRAYLKKRGIHWELRAKGAESVSSVTHAVPFYIKPLRAMDDVRDRIGRLMDSLYPGWDAGYMKGLVVGIRSDLDPGQFDDFSRLGLTHVLAISGLHVGVVVFLLLKITAWMRMTRERSLAVTIALMPVYMMLTGASPSAVRACLMAMLALWLARRHALKDGLHLLSAAAMLMLIWNPLLIEDVSFQLSFIVTAGLLLFTPTVTASLPFIWKWLRAPVAVALTAQFVSFPLTVYYFHTFNLLSLPANLILVPFISFIIMPLGMASIVFGAIWLPLGKIPALLASIGNRQIFDLVEWLNRFGGLRTVWPQPSWLWVMCAYLMLCGIAVLLKKRLDRQAEHAWLREKGFESIQSSGKAIKLGAAAFGALTVFWLVWGVRPAVLDSAAKIMFLDVGQADSILLRTGEGRHILIDSGGSILFRKPGDEWRARRDPFDIGRELLVPLLLQRGVRQLDALVLTHLDTDHIGGAKAVVGSIPVRKILFNGTLKDSSAAKELFRLALHHGIPCYAAEDSMDWEVDRTTTFRILYPQAVHNESGSAIAFSNEQNERSIVLLITVYGRRFLLPGDLGAPGERQIVEAAAAASNGPVDVLKAGHHGSKTSTSLPWLTHWQPVETVISVGCNNFYGHPHPDVVKRIGNSGSVVLRTDEQGEIQYRILPNGQLMRRNKLSSAD